MERTFRSSTTLRMGSTASDKYKEALESEAAAPQLEASLTTIPKKTPNPRTAESAAAGATSDCTCLLLAVRAGLVARFLLTGLGWWGARKRGVPLPCVTSAYTTSSHALQRSVTSLRPTTSSPVHVGLLRLRIPQRRSAFFPERSSPFPRR